MDYPTSPTFDSRADGAHSHSHYCQSRSSTSSTSSSSSKCSVDVRNCSKLHSSHLNSTGSSVRHSSTSSSESGPGRCYCREVRTPSPAPAKPVLRKGEAVDLADIEGETQPSPAMINKTTSLVDATNLITLKNILKHS